MCLKPQVNLSVGMNAFAECSVPPSSIDNQHNRASLRYSTPDGKCAKFQMDTADTWLHYGEHIFFRRQEEKIGVLIINALEEHNNITIVCMQINTNYTVPEGCNELDETTTVIYVFSEDDCKCIFVLLAIIAYDCLYNVLRVHI